ncbi:hypothetical protein, partial [Aeromonas sp.]|uniref:hypothetical protein n=1 Tax=Aeromonas sp. TaxID=647 RepID=UPI002584E250
GVRRRRRSTPVNTSTIFSLRLVLNIVPRLPLKLRGAKCLDLQGANLPYNRHVADNLCREPVLVGLAQCHDLGQEADYSALIPLMTIYLGACPLKSSEKFSLMHIKFK